MYWYCEFCGSSNLESQDLCSNCEVLGCTKNNHLCQEYPSKYNDPEWIAEKNYGEEQ